MNALVILALAPLAALRIPGPLSPRLVDYRIEAELDATRGVIDGHAHVTWRNREAGPARTLVWHLYMNAFRGPDSIWGREARARGDDEIVRANPRGAITVTALRVGGHDLTAALVVDDTLGQVALPEPVPPGGAVEVELTWRTVLPRVVARAGRVGDFFAIAQWFPKLGVFGCPGPTGPAPRECGWRADAYHYLGEFFADYGSYDVAFTLPAGFRVGATGVRVDEAHLGDRQTLRFRAEDVHDFVLAACPRFQEVRALHPDRWGGVELDLLVLPEHAAATARHLRTAHAALDELEQLGPYPYRRLTIVDVPDAAGDAGSQEYPTLVFTKSHDVPAAVHAPEASTAHELAHQYFYGLLGSDEQATPWLDEGLAEHFADRVLARLYGAANGAYELFGHHLAFADFIRLGYRREADLDAPALRGFDFLDGRTYHAASYARIALALATVEALAGRPPVDDSLREYTRRWQFAHPGRADFLGSLSPAARPPGFWEPILESAQPLDYAVRSVDAQPLEAARWISEVVVTRRGAPALPVDVRVRFADGRERVERWDDGRAWRRFVYQAEAPVEQAELAPLPLDVTRWNDGLRRAPDPRPRRRLVESLAVALLALLGALGR